MLGDPYSDACTVCTKAATSTHLYSNILSTEWRHALDRAPMVLLFNADSVFLTGSSAQEPTQLL